jgi:NAD(P)-dependent dehydrogenase (short-subunit alcohol dehydrogenase family)
MFEGKVTLVTRGCRGIGAAITESLAEAGAHVAAGYNRAKDGAEVLAVAHWALQPWLWTGQVASTYARTNASMMTVWHSGSEERPKNGHLEAQAPESRRGVNTARPIS